MKKLCLLGLLGLTLSLAPACGDDDDDGDASGGSAGAGEAGSPGNAGQSSDSGGAGGAGALDGEAACEELGELCHDADDGSGLGAECHDVGHVGDGEVCLERYEECKTYCESVLAEGGAGGGGHAEGGAHGHAEGGAGGELAHAEGGAGGAH